MTGQDHFEPELGDLEEDAFDSVEPRILCFELNLIRIFSNIKVFDCPGIFLVLLLVRIVFSFLEVTRFYNTLHLAVVDGKLQLIDDRVVNI